MLQLAPSVLRTLTRRRTPLALSRALATAGRTPRAARSASHISFYDQSVSHYAQLPTEKRSLRDMVAATQGEMTPARLLEDAAFVHTELPKRLSRRLEDLLSLPHIMVTNPHIEHVYEVRGTEAHVGWGAVDGSFDAATRLGNFFFGLFLFYFFGSVSLQTRRLGMVLIFLYYFPFIVMRRVCHVVLPE
jgi:hypothetical protein